MNIETTHCDACANTNTGCLVHKVQGQTVLALCGGCVTDKELDALTMRSLCEAFPQGLAEVEAFAPSPREPVMASLFLGAWF